MNYQKCVIGLMIGLNALIFVSVDAAAGGKRKYQEGDRWYTVFGAGSTAEKREQFAAENPKWMQQNIKEMRKMQDEGEFWSGYILERDPEDLEQQKAESILNKSSDDEDQPASSRSSRRRGKKQAVTK